VEKDIIFKLIKSIVITALVSIITSISLGLFFGNYLACFLIATLLQFLFFYAVGEILKRKDSKKLLEFSIKQQELMSQQSTTVVCPCDRKIESTIPIRLDRDNTYICAGCNKNINVKAEFKTALNTTPVLINPIDTPILEEHVKQLLAKNNNDI